MSYIVIANLLTIPAQVLMLVCGKSKNSNKILFFNGVQMLIMFVVNILLGVTVGAVCNILGIVRNILCYKNKLNKNNKDIIILLIVVIGHLFNTRGVIGLFPIVASCTYAYMLGSEISKIKLAQVGTIPLWFIYDLILFNYAGVIFDITYFILCIRSLLNIKNNTLLQNAKPETI